MIKYKIDFYFKNGNHEVIINSFKSDEAAEVALKFAELNSLISNSYSGRTAIGIISMQNVLYYKVTKCGDEHA